MAIRRKKGGLRTGSIKRSKVVAVGMTATEEEEVQTGDDSRVIRKGEFEVK